MSAPQKGAYAWTSGLALACLAPQANAEESDLKATAQAPSCPAPHADSDYRHDGFFARSQVGLVLFSALVQNSLEGRQRSQVRAYGQSSEISVGTTVAPGTVLAFSVVSALLYPTFVEHGIRISPDDDSVKVILARVGPLLDWYPNPARGFHTQVAATLALQVENDERGVPLEPGAAGVAVSVGLGYEWFIAREFSVELVARLTGGQVRRADHGLVERSLWEASELALSYTYH